MLQKQRRPLQTALYILYKMSALTFWDGRPTAVTVASAAAGAAEWPTACERNSYRLSSTERTIPHIRYFHVYIHILRILPEHMWRLFINTTVIDTKSLHLKLQRMQNILCNATRMELVNFYCKFITILCRYWKFRGTRLSIITKEEKIIYTGYQDV